MSRELIRRFIRSGVVGVVVMLVFLGLNWVLAHWLSARASFLVAYPPAVAIHFWLNKKWTFGCRREDTARQATQYLAMVGVTFLIQYGLFHAGYYWLGWPHLVAAAVANAGQMVVGFALMQFHIFAPRPARA